MPHRHQHTGADPKDILACPHFPRQDEAHLTYHVVSGLCIGITVRKIHAACCRYVPQLLYCSRYIASVCLSRSILYIQMKCIEMSMISASHHQANLYGPCGSRQEKSQVARVFEEDINISRFNRPYVSHFKL
jgi:hypothetical protein